MPDKYLSKALFVMLIPFIWPSRQALEPILPLSHLFSNSIQNASLEKRGSMLSKTSQVEIVLSKSKNIIHLSGFIIFIGIQFHNLFSISFKIIFFAPFLTICLIAFSESPGSRFTPFIASINNLTLNPCFMASFAENLTQ